MSLVYGNLSLYCLYAFVDHLIARWLEIGWSRVVALRNHIDCARFNADSLVELEEVQPDEVIKVLAEHIIRIEIYPIVQFGEFQNDLYHFWLVFTRKAIM